LLALISSKKNREILTKFRRDRIGEEKEGRLDDKVISINPEETIRCLPLKPEPIVKIDVIEFDKV
jgi:hypothetical protein